ncbi:hypothetical protein Y032_0135g1930 [Ancylostoma ceylanicum]|uniref:Uncharacterized protein n=1 Tax=Ancylostoma ceylanicum TaxID=53326 RepID=A0A016T4S8_9BILA|nr:hypothetical protein Y032_0135g1930 [Ancylostoma ceylanicum]
MAMKVKRMNVVALLPTRTAGAETDEGNRRPFERQDAGAHRLGSPEAGLNIGRFGEGGTHNRNTDQHYRSVKESCASEKSHREQKRSDTEEKPSAKRPPMPSEVMLAKDKI